MAQTATVLRRVAHRDTMRGLTGEPGARSGHLRSVRKTPGVSVPVRNRRREAGNTELSVRTSSVLVAVGLFAVLGAVGVGLGLYKRSAMRAGGGPAFEPAEAVTLATVTTREWAPTTDLVGTVVALRSVTVQNEVAGAVRRVGFESGDIVEAGQVLLEIDDATVQAELGSKEATLRVSRADVQVAEASVRLAESELRMKEAALATRATSAIDVDRARADLDRAKASLDRAKASVDEAAAEVQQVRTRLAKHTIRAPFRSRVGLRTIHEGQFLSMPMGSMGTPVATLQEVGETIFIDFPIPQEQITRVKLGMTVKGLRESAGGAEGGTPISLTVAAIDATASNVTRNVRVRALADNKDGSLRPGMFARLRVPVEQPREHVVLPLRAVRRASYSDQVFVIEQVQEPGPDGAAATKMRARQRFVKLGPTIGDEVVILDGVRAGEQVAVSGAFKLREGSLVMPAAAPNAAPNAAQTAAQTAAPSAAQAPSP